MGSKANIASRIGRTRFAFLISDLEIALTMAGLARNAEKDSDKRIRNQENARQAYVAVLRLSKGMSLSKSEHEQLREKLEELKSALRELGESF